jgi:hypothetical protein
MGERGYIRGGQKPAKALAAESRVGNLSPLTGTTDAYEFRQGASKSYSVTPLSSSNCTISSWPRFLAIARHEVPSSSLECASAPLSSNNLGHRISVCRDQRVISLPRTLHVTLSARTIQRRASRFPRLIHILIERIPCSHFAFFDIDTRVQEDSQAFDISGLCGRDAGSLS